MKYSWKITAVMKCPDIHREEKSEERPKKFPAPSNWNPTPCQATPGSPPYPLSFLTFILSLFLHFEKAQHSIAAANKAKKSDKTNGCKQNRMRGCWCWTRSCWTRAWSIWEVKLDAIYTAGKAPDPGNLHILNINHTAAAAAVCPYRILSAPWTHELSLVFRSLLYPYVLAGERFGEEKHVTPQLHEWK
jgi:hypothetical protein